MEANVNVNADLNKIIEQLADKLGIASAEIIPHYTKMIFVGALSSMIGGLLMVLLPYLLFFIYPETWATSDLFMGLRIIFCIIMTITGGYQIVCYMEDLLAPKAEAIRRLINQLRG